MRIGQLREITGNRIPSYRNQNTGKSTFGKPFCQVAKSRPRQTREGRTWERRPPPRPWAAWPARFFRAHGTPSRVSWRVSSYSSWHVGAAPPTANALFAVNGQPIETGHVGRAGRPRVGHLGDDFTLAEALEGNSLGSSIARRSATEARLSCGRLERRANHDRVIDEIREVQILPLHLIAD